MEKDFQHTEHGIKTVVCCCNKKTVKMCAVVVVVVSMEKKIPQIFFSFQNRLNLYKDAGVIPC